MVHSNSLDVHFNTWNNLAIKLRSAATTLSRYRCTGTRHASLRLIARACSGISGNYRWNNS